MRIEPDKSNVRTLRHKRYFRISANQEKYRKAGKPVNLMPAVTAQSVETTMAGEV